MPLLAKEEWTALGLSTLAGLSTTLGALIAIIKRPDNALLAFLLGMAFGVMVLLSVVELWLHNCLEHGFLGVTGSMLGGAALYLLVHPFIPEFHGAAHAARQQELSSAKGGREAADVGQGAVAQAVSPAGAGTSTSTATGRQHAGPAAKRRGPLKPGSEELVKRDLQRDSPSAYSSDSPRAPAPSDATLAARDAAVVSEARAAELMRLGVLMAITMTLHNAPEGFAVAFASFTDFGGIMALAIAVHNIPEGVIVAAPVYAATGSRWAAVGIALASGLSEPVGALVALLLVKPFLTEGFVHYLLAFVGGVMIAVSGSELWPEGRKCRQHARHWQGIGFGSVVMGGTLLLGA